MNYGERKQKKTFYVGILPPPMTGVCIILVVLVQYQEHISCPKDGKGVYNCGLSKQRAPHSHTV